MSGSRELPLFAEEELAALIGRARALDGLEPEERRRLAAAVRVRPVTAGELIVAQGEPGDHAYLLRHGQACVDLDGEAIATIGPGDVFGEVSVLTGDPRGASVRMSADGVLLEIDRESLVAAVEANLQTLEDLLYVLRMRARPRRAHGVTDTQMVTPDGERITVLKNVAAGTYFRLSPRGRFLWERLDGRSTLRDLTLEWTERFGPIDPNALVSVVLGLERAEMLDGGSLQPRVLAAARVAPLTRRLLRAMRRWWILENVDPGLERAYRRWGRLLFSPVAGVALLLVVAAGAYAMVTGFRAGSAALAQHPAAALLIVPSLLVGTILHEAAHALAVKRYGRVVHRVALGWVLYRPTGFVDTSDMWLSPARERMAVSLAGPIASLATGCTVSVAAGIVDDGLAAAVLWSIAAPMVISVAVQLSPAWQTDGYQILRDRLDRPRLREDAMVWAVRELPALLRRRGGLRGRRAEAGYVVATVVWIAVIAVAQLFVLRRALEHLLVGLGAGGMAAPIALVLVLLPLVVLGLVIGDELRLARQRSM